MRCEQAALNVTEPLYCNQVQSDRIFCVSCDIAESEVEQWLLDNPGCAQGADGVAAASSTAHRTASQVHQQQRDGDVGPV